MLVQESQQRSTAHGRVAFGDAQSPNPGGGVLRQLALSGSDSEARVPAPGACRLALSRASLACHSGGGVPGTLWNRVGRISASAIRQNNAHKRRMARCLSGLRRCFQLPRQGLPPREPRNPSARHHPNPSVVPSRPDARQKKRFRCLSPKGELAKSPAGRSGSEGSPKGHDGGMRLFAYFLAPKKVGRPSGRNRHRHEYGKQDSVSTYLIA